MSLSVALEPVYKNSRISTIQLMDKERISNFERLRAGVQKGLDDSDAGRFTEFNSREALSTHLAALRAFEGQVPSMTIGPERTPLQPWTPAQVAAYRKQRLEEANDANSAWERNAEIAQAHGEKSTAGNSGELPDRPADVGGAQSDSSTNQRERA